MLTIAKTTSLDDFQRWVRKVRRKTLSLCEPLQPGDYEIQSEVFVSPPKWHLAHTTWFFEKLVLQAFDPNYILFNESFHFLFNSYYQSFGRFHPRPLRGQLSRPSVEEILEYRRYVDQSLLNFLKGAPVDALERISLGLNHEQQHQELLLMDVKFNFLKNPLHPLYQDGTASSPQDVGELRWIEFGENLSEFGYQGSGFAYDNEMPRHRAFLEPYRLSHRLVTEGEFAEFVESGAYGEAQWWLADGWDYLQQENWRCPYGWEKREGKWWVMTLSGWREIRADIPVCHVSYYEAQAYARWRGKRLPTEYEWENAALGLPLEGNFMERGELHPLASSGSGLTQMFGDVWEWTQSAYLPYPGYVAATDELGEYNGKFMCNQWVLRGGSCVSPQSHLRATYRNFFHPNMQWQFSGIRLAESC